MFRLDTIVTQMDRLIVDQKLKLEFRRRAEDMGINIIYSLIYLFVQFKSGRVQNEQVLFRHVIFGFRHVAHTLSVKMVAEFLFFFFC